MKKTLILLLLLLATLAVASWYRFPLTYPSINSSSSTIVREPKQVVGENMLVIQPTAAPDFPLAEVEESEYLEKLDIAGSTVYEIVDGSLLDRVRKDGEMSYPGEIMIKEGKIAVKGGKVVAGAFLMDMSSIRLTAGDSDILDDIKGANTLDVEKFPEASFVLKESLDDMIIGVLTIKGVSKQIIFPALLLIDENKLRIYTEFSIDRRYRGITGNSPTLSPYINLSLEWILRRK